MTLERADSLPIADAALRRLGPADLASVMDMHDLACTGIASNIVRPETPAFFERMLGGGAVVDGVILPGRGLIAYAVLQTDLSGEKALVDALKLPPTARIGKLAGVSVAPEWRGHGLQVYLALHRIAIASSMGLDYVFATSSPENPASFRSLLRAGLWIGMMAQVYGGFSRYLLLKSLQHEETLDINHSINIPWDDAPAVSRALNGGFLIYAVDGVAGNKNSLRLLAAPRA